MKIILLGSPGSGKGTQAEALHTRLGVPCISTGNILREAIAQKTTVGLAAKSYIDDGRLVPDEIIMDIVCVRLAQDDCQAGFILDGFPRTLAQAEALDALGVTIDAVLSLEVPDEDIEQRMAGRRSCKVCGSAYHTQSKPPKAEGVCDLCGGELFRRDDDHPDTVRARLHTYHELTEPLKGYYVTREKLISIPARDYIETVTARCLDALGIKL